MSAVDEIIEKVSGLTVLELADCIKKMEEKFGVSAAAAVAVAAPAAGGGGAAECDSKAIDLCPFEHFTSEFRRFAETDRQHSGCERIETAHVPRFIDPQQSPHALRRLRRRQTLGLVEQQQTVDQSFESG